MKVLSLILVLAFVCSCAIQKSSSIADPANKFIASLSEAEKKVTLIDYNDKERHNWTFLPTRFLPSKSRRGFEIKHMSDAQLQMCFDVLGTITSKVGYERAMVIMEYETIMRILEKNPGMRDSKRYFLSLFGTPGTGRWGIRYEGHHLCLNFVIEDDEILSATPFFFGVNPATVIKNGGTKHKVGTRLLAKQEDLAFKLITSFSAEQKKAAVVSEGNPKSMRSYEASPLPMKKAGIAVKNLTKEQKETFKMLLHTFTENAESSFAAESNFEFEAEMDKMYLSWYGNTMDLKIPHSFIIDGPVTFIRFSNWATDSLKTKANHLHSLWRNRAKDFAYKIE
jgi:hypothetical protein